MAELKKKAVIQVKPYTLKELGDLYGVHWRTIKTWLKPFEAEVGQRTGRYYLIPQVKIIFEKLGLPSVIEVEQ